MGVITHLVPTDTFGGLWAGNPVLEEAHRVGEGWMPRLRQRGLPASETPTHDTVEV